MVASPLPEELCRLIEEREPRIELVREHDLLPPMRRPGDHGGDPSFSRTSEQQQAFEALVDSADLLYGIPDEDAQALSRTATANPKLRWVHTTAAGGGAAVKAAGLSAEQLERITFTTSAGVHGGTLAEFAIFGVLAGFKDLTRLQRQQQEQNWSERWIMRQLSEATVLVVGLGGIGREVAEKLAALGATVIGSRRGSEPVEHVDRLVAPDDLAAVVGEVDAIVVTLPGTAATEKLIGAEVLAAVKPDTVLVNVGRGTVIDEEALLPALSDGRVSLAVLDVFATEPLPEASPLWRQPNVIVSPHTAALNGAEDRRIAELFAANAGRLLDGEELANVVDTVDFY